MDDDAKDIPPALSGGEWFDLYTTRPGDARVQIYLGERHALCIGKRGPDRIIVLNDVNDLAALIALANETLRRMDDPRAITREQVSDLRDAISNLERLSDSLSERPDLADSAYPLAVRRRADALSDVVDALESYLPPI